jgi:hypothetical protein
MTYKMSWVGWGIIGIFVATFDWFGYLNWQWVIDHETCIVHGLNGELVTTICWGVSPFPMYILTLLCILVTVIYIYKIVRKMIDTFI